MLEMKHFAFRFMSNKIMVYVELMGGDTGVIQYRVCVKIGHVVMDEKPQEKKNED